MADNLFPKKTETPAAPITAPILPEKATEAPDTSGSDMEMEALPKVDELSMLKQRAKMLGIAFSNNIGLDALRAKVNAKVQGEESPADETDDSDDTEEAAEKPPEKAMTLRQQLNAEQMKLVRVRVTCLDPKKKDLPGEIFTVGNKYIGTVKKFVPFGEMTDNGYHIPFIIHNMMKEREFVSVKTRKTPRGPIVETSMAREFALEVLPPLTEAELSEMRAAQASRGDAA